MESKFFHHPQFLYNDIFIIDFSEFYVFSSVIFLYMNKYFKWFWTEGGHIQFIVIISLVLCGQTQEVNESNVDNETNVDSWR